MADSPADERLALFWCIKPSKKGPPWCHKARHYWKTDAEMLERVLTARGFTCQEPIQLAGPKKIDEELENLAASNITACKFLFIFVSSYGIRTDMLLVDGKPYNLREKIDNYLTKKGSAFISAEKCFFVQACWKSTDEGHDGLPMGDGGYSGPSAGPANITTFWSAFHSDLLRNPQEDAVTTGSPAVARFCEVLGQSEEPILLRDVLTRVQDSVVKDIEGVGKAENKYLRNESTSPTDIKL